MIIIESSLAISEDELQRYAMMLEKRNPKRPYICAWAKCGQLIGSIEDVQKIRSCNIDCSNCGRRTCKLCREQGHSGECLQDPTLLEYLQLQDIRRCINCGQLTEKDGGCEHMICSGCGIDYKWLAGGLVERYRTR